MRPASRATPPTCTTRFRHTSPVVSAALPFRTADPETSAWYPLYWPFLFRGSPCAPFRVAGLECVAGLYRHLLLPGAHWRKSRPRRPRRVCLLGLFAGHSSQLPVFRAAACFPWLLLSFRGACDYTALGGLAGSLTLPVGYCQSGFTFFSPWRSAPLPRCCPTIFICRRACVIFAPHPGAGSCRGRYPALAGIAATEAFRPPADFSGGTRAENPS